MLHCIALSSLQDELFFLTEEQQHIAYFAYTLMLCTAIQVDDNKPNQTKPASLLLPLPFSRPSSILRWCWSLHHLKSQIPRLALAIYMLIYPQNAAPILDAYGDRVVCRSPHTKYKMQSLQTSSCKLLEAPATHKHTPPSPLSVGCMLCVYAWIVCMCSTLHVACFRAFVQMDAYM